jgi:pimeloyl-ACP methyl ester carboxylesterase
MQGGRSGRRYLCVAALGLLCTSCADLRSYRDDEYLQRHRYALGEQYTQVNGLRICYQEFGHGPDVVIIPGLATSMDYWQLVIPALAERYHVLTLDPAGTGKSDKPDVKYDLPWTEEQIRAFVHTRGVQRASYIGGSLGGQLAVMIALDHPEEVDKLVLMGSCGSWPKTGPVLDAALGALWSDNLAAEYLRCNWPWVYHRIVLSDTPVSREIFRYEMAVRAHPERYDPEGVAASRGLLGIFHTDLQPRISQLRQDALLVWGEQDHIHLPSEAKFFRAHLPSCKLVVVPGAGHEVILDRPEEFNRVTLQFLAEGLGPIEERGW